MQLQAIKRIQIEATSRGVDETRQKLDGLAGAQDNVARSAERQARSTLSMERALERRQRLDDRAYRDSRSLAESQRIYNAALAQGLISQPRHNELMLLAAQRYQGAATANDNLSRAALAANMALSRVGLTVPALGAGMGVIGALAAGIGGLAVAAVRAVSAFQEFESQQFVLQSVLKATGFSAGQTAEDIERLAAEIGDIKNVRQAAAQLLTFRSIAGETFERTLKLADDLAAVGFGTIQSAAVQLGKALEDPEQGLSALTRVGVSFSAQQKQVIKDLADTGRTAEAQRLILDQVEKQVGGAGAAQDRGLAGAYEALGDATRRLLEQWGKQIATAFSLANAIRGIAAAIDEVRKRGEPAAQLDERQAIIERNLRLAEEGRFSIIQRDNARWAQHFREELEKIKALRWGEAMTAALEQEGKLLGEDIARREQQRERIESVVAAVKKETDEYRKSELQKQIDLNLRKAGVTAASAEGQEIIRLTTIRENERRAAEKRAQAEREAESLSRRQAEQLRRAGEERSNKIRQLEIEAKTIGLTEEQATALRAREEELAELRVKGIRETPALVAQIDAWAVAYARAKTEVERLREAQEGLRKAQAFLGESFADVIKEMVTGAGDLKRALDQLSKSFINAGLDALLLGKGPLAGILGTTATERGQTGGLLGFLMGSDVRLFRDMFASATERGIVAGWENIVRAANQSRPGGGIGGGLGLFGRGAIGLIGAASAFGAGYSSANMAQGLVGGALSGAVAGTAILPGIGTVVGAIGGAILGGLGAWLGKSSREKQELEEAKKAWRDMQSQLLSFSEVLSGRGVGAVTQAIRDVTTQLIEIAEAAAKARAWDDLAEIQRAFNQFISRTVREFVWAFNDVIGALNAGLGFDSPWVRASQQIKQVSESLKGFLADTATAFSILDAGSGIENGVLVGRGDPSAQVDLAREAVRNYLLTLIAGGEQLSDVESRLAEIRGTAYAVAVAFDDLGFAFEAIEGKVAEAIARLRQDFERDIERGIDEAAGKGWINEIGDLIADVARKRSDALLLGADPALIDRYLVVSAQKIVDSAQLAGEAFDDLLVRFPLLAGLVHEFTAVVDEAAKAAEIARRKAQFEDRLFFALLDTSTLEGQLAAFDRRAMREREAEIAAGGEALVELEAALAQERLNIQRDFAARQQQEFERTLTEATNFLAGFRRRIREFVDHLLAGSQSPLGPLGRLQAAQSAYSAQLSLAAGGDRDALSSITSYASDLIEAARGYHASSPDFQAIFQTVLAQLQALPEQVSPEQLIVNAIADAAADTIDAIALMRTTLNSAISTGNPAAIASALSQYFTMLDTSVDGLLDFNEMLAALGTTFTTGTLRGIFNELDGNGNGVLEKSELIKVATQGSQTTLTDIKTIDQQQQTILQQQKDIQTAMQSLLDLIRGSSAATQLWTNTVSTNTTTQISILQAIQSLNATSTQQLQLLLANFGSTSTTTTSGGSVERGSPIIVWRAIQFGQVTLFGTAIELLRKIAWNTAATADNTFGMLLGGSGGQAMRTSGIYPFQHGGWVVGGIVGRDSVPIMGMPGEFVVRAAAARRAGRWLEHLNATGQAPAAADSGAVVAELRRLIERLARLEQRLVAAEIAAAEHVREGIDRGNAAAADIGRRLRRAS